MKNIPKICHLIWTNGSPMSLLQVFTVITFHKQNPEWQIIIHLIKQTTDQLAANKYTPDYNKKDNFYLIKAFNYVTINNIDLIKEGIGVDKHGILASDILRIKILYEQGGLYSDFDMLWLRPMSEFKNISCIGNVNDFETTVCYYNFIKGHHNNSNLISEAKGGYLYSIYQEQKKIKPPYRHQTFNTDLLNRKYPELVDIFESYPRVLAIRYNTFYPYSIFRLNELYQMDTLIPIEDKGVMGVHWFNGHELSHDYVMNGGFERKCSMTSILKKEELI